MSSQTQQRSPRFFYGWVIVGVAAVKGSFMVGSAAFASSVFLLPMQAELGWSRTLLFGALAVRGLIAGVLQPWVGPLGDHRWAPRLVVPIGALLLGFSFMMIKWVEEPWAFYLWYGLVGALGMALISAAIMDAVVLKWFLRKRPQALLWVNQGPGTAPLIFPIVLTALIAAVGWRDAWFWFGVGTIAVLLPLSLLIRTRPELMGQLPDGEPPVGSPRAAGQPRPTFQERSFTRAEALRTPAFWTLSAVMALGVFGTPGFQAHWIPYLRDQGFDAGLAATAITGYGLFGITSRFVWAYLTARYTIRQVFVAQALLSTLVPLLLLVVQGTVLLFAWAMFTGITLVAFWQLQAMIAVTYFGREHIGAIRGLMWPLSTVSGATSLLVLGALRDWYGSYTLSFILVAAAWGLCALLLLATKSPQRTAASEGTPA
jgi:MFS family permease